MAGKTVHSKVVISAKESVSATLKDLQGRFRAFSKSASSLGGELRGLASVSLAPLAGGLAAAAGALKSSVSSMSQYGTEVDNVSRSLGVAGDSLQAFRYAATLGGSSASEMDGAIAMLNKNMANAAAGKNKALVELMAELGVSMRGPNGEMKTAAELMPEIADCLRSQTNATQRAYIATQFFGRSGQNLIKTLADGSEGLDKARAEAEKFGVIMSAEDVAAATLFGDSLTRTQYAIQGVQNSIGAQLMPVLQPMVDGMNDWIAANREWIATEVGNAARDLAESFKDINFKDVVEGMINLAKRSVQVFTSLGGVKTVAIAVGAIFAGKVVAGIVSTVGAFGSMIGTAASLAKAIWAVNAAILANPIALIIAGIVAAVAAVGAAVYYIYDNWDAIASWFGGLWEDTKAVFSGFTSWCGGLWDGMVADASLAWQIFKSFFTETIPSAAMGAWDSVSGWFGGLWDGMVSGGTSVLQGLATFFTETIPNAIKAAWGAFKDWFLGILDTMLGPAREIIGVVAGIGGAVGDAVSGAASWVGDKASGAWDAVSSWWNGDDEGGAQPVPAASAQPVAQSVSNALPAMQESRFKGDLEVRVRADAGAEAEVSQVRGDNPAMQVGVRQERGASR